MTSGSHHSILNFSALGARVHQWLMAHKVAFLSDPSLQASAPILILPRHTYRELHKDYPLEQRRELQKVLKVEYEASPFIRHVFGESSHGKTAVSSYLPDPAIVAGLTHNAVLLPETFLLGLALEAGQAARVQTNSHSAYFVANVLGQVRSLQQSALCSDAAAFLLYVGLPDDAEVLSVGPEQYERLWQKGFSRLKATDFVNFWQSRIKADAVVQWQPLAIATAICISTYAALSSAWLVYQVSDSQAQMTAQGSELNDVLAIQQELNAIAATSEKLNQEMVQNISSAQVWAEILSLQDRGDTLQSISMKAGRLEVRGYSAKATDTLQHLANSPVLSNAQFISPVTKQRKQESYTIAAQLKQETSNAAK